MWCLGKRPRSPPTDDELRRLLPRELLLQIAGERVPLDHSRDLTYEELGDDPPFTCAWPALQALSKYGPEHALAIDFMAAGVVPPPADHEFPLLALGLISLLDQAARHNLHGVNQRYIGAYFDPMALKFFLQCRALDPALWPWNRQRWTKDLGYSTHQWIWAQLMLFCPSCHSEDIDNHKWHLPILRSARVYIAASNDGLSNPYALDLEGELGRDIYAFSRVAMKGPPTPEELGREPRAGDMFYWYDMIIHLHKPVIRKFGRYPYRNSWVGRSSTEKEVLWLTDTNGYATIDEESAKKVREDVKRGVWSPLERE